VTTARFAALLLLVASASAAGRAAQSPPGVQLPDGSALLDEMEKKDRQSAQIKVRKSVIMEGSCSIRLVGGPAAESTPGEFEEYFQGGQYYHFSDFEKLGKVEQGTDGKVTWEIDPMAGAMIQEGAAEATIQRIVGLTLGDSWREHFDKTTCVAVREVNDRPCFVLKMTPKLGKDETWYVDRERKQLAGIDMWLHVPGGEQQAEIRFADWQAVDGIPYPHTMKVKIDHANLTYKYETITHNEKIPASRFALPDEVREAVAKRKRAKPAATEIVITELPERHVATIRAKVKLSQIGGTLAVVIPEVMGHLAQCGVMPQGPPFTRYHSFDGDQIDLEAGFPVPEPIEETDRIKARVLPTGKVARTWHIGHYNKLGETYQRIEDWLAENGIESRDVRWEVYWTDPGRERDPSKWRTQVFWAIK
jgi:effector-binding domain-containing protein